MEETKKLMNTGIKSEEIGISWQMGCWWEGRGGRGKRFLLCRLIFDLLKLSGDFKGKDAQCSFALSAATASLTCTYSRTKLAVQNYSCYLCTGPSKTCRQIAEMYLKG